MEQNREHPSQNDLQMHGLILYKCAKAVHWRVSINGAWKQDMHIEIMNFDWYVTPYTKQTIIDQRPNVKPENLSV